MGKFYRINQYIQAKEVRVISEEGKQIGVMPIFNALQEARKLGVDLVEVAPNANPPVCKLIDFKKFKYLEAKKEKEAKRSKKRGELKEIRLSPFIAENDLEFRLKRAEEFLREGSKVRLTVRFTGRQLGHKEFGQQILNKAILGLEGIAKIETEPRWLGKDLYVILALAKKEKSKNEQENEN